MDVTGDDVCIAVADDVHIVGEFTARFCQMPGVAAYLMYVFCFLDALYSAFSSCAAVLYGCQMLAVLEVINAAVGLVRTPVFPAMIQARHCIVLNIKSSCFELISIFISVSMFQR